MNRMTDDGNLVMFMNTVSDGNMQEVERKSQWKDDANIRSRNCSAEERAVSALPRRSIAADKPHKNVAASLQISSLLLLFIYLFILYLFMINFTTLSISKIV
jgi:hypothetical protein